MTAVAEIKGWCPGARRPMPSGDGLIVRVRPHGGALSVSALGELARAAQRFGNGQIDLTRRANLQIRGVSDQTLVPLWDLMAALDLLDASAELEAIRNIVVNPLAGLDPAEILDMRPVAAALETRLASDQALQALPAKFGFALDGGGRLPLADLAADVRLVAQVRDGDCRVAIGLSGSDDVRWLGTTSVADAASVAIQLTRVVLKLGPTRRSATLLAPAIATIGAELGLDGAGAMTRSATPQRRCGVIALTDQTCAVGLGAPFGRLDSDALTRLADVLATHGVSEVRLSPWRTLYVPAGPEIAAQIVADAARLGLIVDDADPLMRIDACSGAGCCPSTGLATRQHARVLADAMRRTQFKGTLHVSGCAKGCARSAPADIVLIGEGERYHLVRDGTVRTEACGTVDAAGLDADGDGLFEAGERAHV
ncbi:precorrin-3B synthase [Bradyrhizobium sp. SSBR45G]|uniref:precorrin-3B synthase n=1 Tax=unclassified Bradyrhizobium TaxID=2631580 RepID=UPI002342988F|nr:MULTISPECIES: precorrin-3B synthase [unclassified Bradyrhizobium]GLH79368.1 precorrin-3B synthase [Bradyrhizobium sp. SSBR45G]GLH86696.1 precorrin-3B synthase [Bradyrhizobium sp. SSBR45R]